MTGKQLGAALGSIAFVVAVAIGVVAFKHFQEQPNPEVKWQPPAQQSGEKDALDNVLEATSGALDALAATVARAENKELPAATRLELVEGGQAECDRLNSQFDEVKAELAAAIKANRIDAVRLGQIRATLDKQFKQWDALSERLKASGDAAIAELKAEAKKK